MQKQSEQRDYYKILGVKRSAPALAPLGRRPRPSPMRAPVRCRSASKQEITKAYRKAAQKWHPDNFHGDEKKLAEKKFIDVAAAKEVRVAGAGARPRRRRGAADRSAPQVLTDPEKRAQFDQGVDPLDPEAQRAGGHEGPFHAPFHHFQYGSPFQFKFHFN